MTHRSVVAQSEATQQEMHALAQKPRLEATGPEHLMTLIASCYNELVDLSSTLPEDENWFSEQDHRKLLSISLDGKWESAMYKNDTAQTKRDNPSKLQFAGVVRVSLEAEIDEGTFGDIFDYLNFSYQECDITHGEVVQKYEFSFCLDDFPMMYEQYQRLSDVAERAMELDEKAHLDAHDRFKTYANPIRLAEKLRSLISERRQLQTQIDEITRSIEAAENDLHSERSKIKEQVLAEHVNTHLAQYELLDTELKLGKAGPYIRFE